MAALEPSSATDRTRSRAPSLEDDSLVRRNQDQPQWLDRIQLAAALLWAGGTFWIFLRAWRMADPSPSDEAGLTMLAMLGLLVALVIRRAPDWLAQSRAASQSTSAMSDDEILSATSNARHELVWLGAWAGQVNMLGLVGVLAPSWLSVLPSLIVYAIVEGLLLYHAPVVWLSTLQRWRNAIDTNGARAELACSGPPVREETATNFMHEGAAEQEWLRSSVAGRSESGEHYLSGWVRFQLAESQKAAHLSIGFSPSFAGVPTIELDHELEQSHPDIEAPVSQDDQLEGCDVQLEHATPAGMRVIVKRSNAHSPLRGKLLWHATADPTQIDASTALLASKLP